MASIQSYDPSQVTFWLIFSMNYLSKFENYGIFKKLLVPLLKLSYLQAAGSLSEVKYVKARNNVSAVSVTRNWALAMQGLKERKLISALSQPEGWNGQSRCIHLEGASHEMVGTAQSSEKKAKNIFTTCSKISPSWNESLSVMEILCIAK